MDTIRASKHKRSHGKDSELQSRKRVKHKHGKKSSKTDDRVHVMDDDPNDEDLWVEKNVDIDGEKVLPTTIPASEALQITSQAPVTSSESNLPPLLSTESPLKRDDWMLEGTSTGDAVGPDFFSGMGTIKHKKPPPENRDPEKMTISSRELNIQLKEGKSLDEYSTPAPKEVTPGGPGSQWRMMKLRRVYETAEEEGKSIEEVAIDRFSSMEAFEQAKAERRILDEREGRRSEQKPRGREREAEKRYLFNDIGGSAASSRSSSFRRPAMADSAPSTPSPLNLNQSEKRRIDPSRQTGTSRSHVSTPVPSVMTPSIPTKPTSSRASSPTSLNRLQAKVLRAKLMGGPEAATLEKEYDEALKKANEGPNTVTKVQVLPTLDAQGRLYDVGTGKDTDPVLPGNRRKKEKVETRDPKTGDIVRYNADDDTTTLGEMLRQERFGAGASDQKTFDGQLANAIMSDGKFENDLEYIDDNAEKLGRRKMKSDAMKRQFAINDYKRTQKVLSSCPFCFGDDDSPPKAPMVALGTRVYLSCTTQEALVDGHCLIVPIQHHLNMLEGDDDVWDEVRNYMKCLMRMFAEEDKGVIFYETVISLKHQKHTVIECVPVPWAEFEILPGYFRQSILQSETEWSQHKKLIDFSARPGGFRRAMVPNLPYFMVQFDYKGEKGYGHVIEGTNAAEETEEGMDEGEKGGGEFPRYFAGEIIGNVLDVEPRKWRRPRKLDWRDHKGDLEAFKNRYKKYDWTGMLSGK